MNPNPIKFWSKKYTALSVTATIGVISTICLSSVTVGATDSLDAIAGITYFLVFVWLLATGYRIADLYISRKSWVKILGSIALLIFGMVAYSILVMLAVGIWG